MSEHRYLEIYLRDHLAMAKAGVEFIRRVVRENQGNQLAGELGELAREIEAEEGVVEEVLELMGVQPSQMKNVGAMLAEKAGRLKFNGEWGRYSPLSRLFEIEFLMAVSEVRRGLWETLADVRRLYPQLEGIPLEELAHRAKEQKARMDELHQKAARAMLRVGRESSRPGSSAP